MDQTIVWILELPLVVRASVFMFIIWIIYILLSSYIAKILMYVPALFNLIWKAIYKIVNGLVHIVHHNFGKAFLEIDNITTGFFSTVYNFVDKIRVSIGMHLKTKSYSGIAFLICTVLAIWIALPEWLHTENSTSLLTIPYQKYIEIEDSLISTVLNLK